MYKDVFLCRMEPKQLAVVLPGKFVEFINKEAERMMITRAAVLRQLVAQAIDDAPHVGITPAGTRRVLLMHEDTKWVTTHVTDLTDPDAIVAEITDHDNPLLPEGFVDAAFQNPPTPTQLPS